MFISHRHRVVLTLCGMAVFHPAAAAETTTPDAPPADIASVQALLREVLINHSSVRAARADWEAAQASSEAATQPLFNPELEIATERTDISTTIVGLSQTLDWHDKRAEHMSVAEQEQLAAREALRATEHEVATATLMALGRYHTARELAALRSDQSKLLQQVSALAEERLKAGDISPVEDDLVHLAAAKVSIQANQAHSALAEAAAALELAAQLSRDDWPRPPMNIEPGELPPQPLPLWHAPGVGSAEWERVLDALPSVRTLRARWQMADAQARLVDKEGRADPTLSLTLGREDEDNLVGVAVSVPLHVRRTYTAQTRAAQHTATAARARFDEARQQARTQLLQSAAQFRLAVNAWQRWHKAGHRSVNEQLQALERLWRGGDLSTSDYLLQVSEYVEAQVMAAELRGSAWETWFRWLSASGRLADWLPENR